MTTALLSVRIMHYNRPPETKEQRVININSNSDSVIIIIIIIILTTVTHLAWSRTMSNLALVRCRHHSRQQEGGAASGTIGKARRRKSGGRGTGRTLSTHVGVCFISRTREREGEMVKGSCHH